MEPKKEIKRSQYPEAVVGALIVNKDGLVLLGKNKDCNGKYTIFGGHVEEGESLENAVIREVKEETGLEVVVGQKINFSSAILHKQKGNYFFTDFVCRYGGIKDDVILDESEFEKDEYVWVDPEGALKLDIAVGTKNVIERYLEEKKKTEYLSGWQRCLADFENYKKRQLETQRNVEQFSKERVILEILPVVDNFEASLSHVPEKERDGAWVVGINHIKTQLENILKENGVMEIETKVGDEFNPEIHEALQADMKETNKKTKGVDRVKSVIQKGYKSGDRVIRAVKVIVD